MVKLICMNIKINLGGILMNRLCAAAACMVLAAVFSGCSDKKKDDSAGKESEEIISPKTVT